MEAENYYTTANTWEAQVHCIDLTNEGGKLRGAADLCAHAVKNKQSLYWTGVGKSGYIARLMSATAASMGCASHWLDPADSIHGDIGKLRTNDVLIIITHSGETAELKRLLECLPRPVQKIAITNERMSSVGRQCDYCLVTSTKSDADKFIETQESCLDQMTKGYALINTIRRELGEDAYDFASYHPGGAIGWRLSGVVDEVMVPVNSVRRCATFAEMCHKMDRGIIAILDGNGRLEGCATDGDIRRAFDSDVRGIMTVYPKTCKPGTSINDAIDLCNKHGITALFVVDDDNRPLGVVHLHDMLRGAPPKKE